MYFWCASVPKLDFGPSVVSLVQDEDVVSRTDALPWFSDGQWEDDRFGFYASPQVFGLRTPDQYAPHYQGQSPETQLLRSQGSCKTGFARPFTRAQTCAVMAGILLAARRDANPYSYDWFVTEFSVRSKPVDVIYPSPLACDVGDNPCQSQPEDSGEDFAPRLHVRYALLFSFV